ncbi:MAG TPA: glycosyltransferase family 9 protein [Luteolibacter sp.]
MTQSASNRLLFASPTTWAEACFSVPAVRAMLAAGLPVTVLCPVEQEAFWETLPGLERIAYGAKTSVKALAAQLAGRFAAAFLWEAGLAADACAKANIARRTGPAGDKALMKRLTDPAAPSVPGPIEHRVRHYLGFVETMGLDTRIARLFEPVKLDVAPSSGSILLVPDSDFGRSHEWPLDRWEELARTLLEKDAALTVATDRPLGRELAGRLGDSAVALALPAFGNCLPVLAGFERVIAADGSLPHLASHVGATCTVLFGPNEPEWKRPLGKRHTVLRRHVECSPCFSPKCAMDLRCQRELTVEQVSRAIG